MDNSMKILLVVVAIILVGLPLAGRLAKEDSAKQQAVETATTEPTPAPTSPIAAPTPQYSPPPQPSFQAPPPPQAVQAPPRMAPPPGAPGKQPPLLNAQNLANSVWQMKVDKFDVRIQLFAGGSALATAAGLPMAIQGTWSVNGASLNITAMGKSESAQIVGDQIMVNGVPAQRIQ